MEGTLQYPVQQTLHCGPHCDQISQKPVITSLDLPPTIDEVSKAIRQTSCGKSLRLTGFLQRSSSQQVQWPSKHSIHSSPVSGKRRMYPKNSGMPHSSPCSITGAIRLTAATTGAYLSCALLGRSNLQIIVNKFADTSRLFGLTISLGET